MVFDKIRELLDGVDDTTLIIVIAVFGFLFLTILIVVLAFFFRKRKYQRQIPHLRNTISALKNHEVLKNYLAYDNLETDPKL